MEVPRLWRLNKARLNVVVLKDGKIFLRGRECVWDGETLRFVDDLELRSGSNGDPLSLAVSILGTAGQTQK